ncbi:hypothetical protein AB0N76_39245, partial [Kitasatospora sp. NPDC093806]
CRVPSRWAAARSPARRTSTTTGAGHLPLHQLHRRSGELPADRPVWVHCAGGMRAGIAASLLDAAGFEVIAVDDAFGAAAEAGLAVVTPAPSAPATASA